MRQRHRRGAETCDDALFDCGGAGDLRGLAACAHDLGSAAGCEAVAAADELVLDCR